MWWWILSLVNIWERWFFSQWQRQKFIGSTPIVILFAFFLPNCLCHWLKNHLSHNYGVPKMFSFPMQKSTKDTTLDVGEDQVVLHVHPARYHLDLGLPFDVDSETCGAQYNRKIKVKSRYKKNKMLLCIFSHWQRNLTNKPH